MTRRTVEQRVKEINAATGVIVPYGVRSSWRVGDTGKAESEIHALLVEYRVRDDREFFEIPFPQAFRLINNYLNDERRQRVRRDD